MSDPNSRIERIESRSAIVEVVHRYAMHMRRRSIADSRSLFTEDAVFEVRQAIAGSDECRTRFRLEGRDAILKYLIDGEAAATPVCPLIHNLIVEVDGDIATADSVMTTLVWPQGRQIVGEYQDRLQNRDGWRFSSRLLTILGQFGGDTG